MVVAFEIQAQNTFKVDFTDEFQEFTDESFELTFNCQRYVYSKTGYRPSDFSTQSLQNNELLSNIKRGYYLEWCYYEELTNAGEMDSYVLQKQSPILDGLYQYYYRNGQESRSGYYINREKSGEWVRWYPNGQKMSEGSYYDGFKIGKWTTWYQNGAIRSSESYITDIKFINAIRKHGIFTQIKSSAEDQLPVMDYYSAKELQVDTSIWFFPNGQISSIENWNITLAGIEQWNEKGQKLKIYFEDRYIYLDQLPKFNGELYSFFLKNLNIKRDVLKKIKQIQVSYKITKEGRLKDIKVIKPKNSEYEANIIKAVQQMEGKWAIARTHNLPQNVKYDLTMYLN